MIDLFLRLTDKLTELARYRASLNTRRFSELVGPIYLIGIDIHNFYDQLLTKVIDDLIRRQMSMQLVESNFHDLVSRDKSKRTAVLNQILAFHSESKTDLERKFFEAFASYFDTVGLETHAKCKIEHRLHAETKRLLLEDEVDGRRAVNLAEDIIELQENLTCAWAVVTYQYAKLRSRSIQ